MFISKNIFRIIFLPALKCSSAPVKSMKLVAAIFVIANIISPSVYSVDYFWAMNVTYHPSKSPADTCRLIRADLLASGAHEIGDYWLVKEDSTGYNCFINRKTFSGWVPFRYFIGRNGDGCKYAYDPIASECVDKNQGKTCPKVGNPINVNTGYKYQIENDYENSYRAGVSFIRKYNHVLNASYWHFSYQQTLNIENFTDYLVITSFRPDGREYKYARMVSSGAITNDPDIQDQLVSIEDEQGGIIGWQLILTDDTVETYDVSGKLLTITDRANKTQTLGYDLTGAEGGDDDPDTLDQVIDDYGSALSFTYDSSSRIIQMVDPEGEVYRYAYDANGMLQYVSYPDNTPGTSGSNPFGEDNPYRTYHYEDTNFPTALTGITDETGNRYATWIYDSAGRAISSEHSPGSGTDHVTLDYTYIDDATDPMVTVTNELGKDTTYHYTTIHGVRKVTQVEGHPTANCVGANKHYTYDANGFLDTVTDWEGNITDYDHDSRGLEIKRVEAKGTAQERTILTEWETNYRLPKKITEPERVIDFSYDANGQLLERKETPISP